MVRLSLVCFVLLWLIGCTDSAENRFDRLNRNGIDFYARRDYPEALSAWQSAREIKPDNESVLMSIGNTYLKMAALAEAVEIFEEAVRRHPENLEARAELVRLLMLIHNIGAAETHLKELQKKAPSYPLTQILVGDLHLLNHRADLAQSAYIIAATNPAFADIALMKLAFCHLTQKDTQAAEKAYQRVVDMAPKAVPVLLQMHYFWKFRDNFEKAEAFLQEALKTDPENLSLLWEQAEFYFGKGHHASARSSIEKILKIYPENRSANIFLAEILMAQQDTQAAGELLDKLSPQGETHPEVALLQGKYHLGLNNPAIAMGFFKQAIQLEPNLPMAHYLLAVSYLANGRHHLARQSLGEALKRDPFFTDAELLLADVYYQLGEYDDARVHAARIVDREAENARAHMILGHIYLVQGEIDLAAAAYLAAQKLNPESIAAVFYRAIAAEKARKTETAIGLYRDILSLNAELADAGLRYCRLLIQTGATQKAIDYFERAVSKAPQHGHFHFILGEAYLSANRLVKAKQAYQTAVTLSPNLVSAYDRLLAFAEKANDTKEQLQLLTTCIENNPTYIIAYLKLAQRHLKALGWEEAIAVLEKGLTRNPDSGWLKNALAWIYLEQNDQLNKALDLAQSAHELLPEVAAISDTLGWAYHKKGFHQQAIWILKAAAGKNPSIAMLLFHLGFAQHAGGEFSEATATLQQALALKLENPYRDEARSLLEKMISPTETPSETRLKQQALQIPSAESSIEEFDRMLNRPSPESIDIGIDDLRSDEPIEERRKTP